MHPYATGISHDNPLRIDALYGCPYVLPKEHTFNFITPRYFRIEKKSLMEPLYLRAVSYTHLTLPTNSLV